jgi:glycogenin glucosyltransferase
MNFPATHYEMSQDAGLFIPPARYPSPPKNMWFDVPKEPPSSSAHRSQSIFPWEVHQPRPSRYFAADRLEQEVQTEPSTQGGSDLRIDTRRPQTADSSARPTTPTITISRSDPWTSFPRLNAWDDMPEIGRYVEGLQKHRRVKSQGSAGSSLRALSPSRPGVGSQKRSKPQGFLLTDFPSETERPSLPVTPAPIRRPSFWGDDNTGFAEDIPKQPLPAAEGVPAQSEWVCVHGRRWRLTDCPCNLTNVTHHHKDPATQLQKLAQQQSEALLRKLSSEGFESGVSRDIPTRPMPFGSEDLKLPAQPQQTAGPGSPSRQQPSGRVTGTVDRTSSSFTSAPEPGPTS